MLALWVVFGCLYLVYEFVCHICKFFDGEVGNGGEDELDVFGHHFDESKSDKVEILRCKKL